MTLLGRSSRERRTVIAGAGIIITLVLFGRVLPAAAVALSGVRRESEDVLRERDRAVAQVQALRALRDLARARQERLGLEFPSLLHAATPATAVASIVGEVSETASEYAVRVTSIDGVADTLAVGPYLLVRARAEVLGDVRGVASMIAALESSETRLRVVALGLTQAEPAASPQQLEQLRASLTVEGLARRPAPRRATQGSTVRPPPNQAERRAR